MTLSSRHLIVGLALLAAWMTLAGSAQARSSFPGGKPITLLVGYAAGGTTDAAARFVAKDLEKELSTSVQVVNKPGAASQLALTTLRQARPDGLTLAYAVLPTISPTTSSARARTDGGIVRPRALAVRRLITNSNLVGGSTAKILAPPS